MVLPLALLGSEFLAADGLEWKSLHERIYSGQSLELLAGETGGNRSIRRFELLLGEEGPVSFGNVPSTLDLSYLSVSANGQQVVGMGNLVQGAAESGEFVQAVKAVLVTWARASDWPEWSERDQTGYHHLVEAGIYSVQRSGAGEILDFQYVGASECLVHIPWRPMVAPDGGPYPYNGYAFEVTVPFVDPVALPEEYVVLISYSTESAGAAPIGGPGPYNVLNYGLRRGAPEVGADLDSNSLVQVTAEGWNYSASWGGLGSIMTEVLSRAEESMVEVALDAPSNAGASVTAVYDGEDPAEQALVRIRPRPVTVTALEQERRYGDVMLLDETGFTVLDQDGDSVLPNGELIEVVHLESATQVDRAATADAGVYADEITIVGQEGSNGFTPSNYEVTYVRGDLVVNQRPVTVTALQQERVYGDVMLLDETGFTVLDQDGDSVLPNGELIEVVHLESATQVDRATLADAGVYADEITIVAQEGSSGFSSSNYALQYVDGDLVVRRRAVTLTALDQSRIYGDVMELDESAFEVLDLDGDSVLPNGESVDEVDLESVTGRAVSTVADAGVYADEIQIAGQEGSNGFSPANYELTYVRGDLLIRAVVVEIALGERVAFRCGRGRGLWVQSSPEGVEVVVEYNGASSVPQTLGEHEYYLRIQDPNYVASQATGSFQVVERTYEVWSRRFLAATEFAAPEHDPDHDGINNLLEFALDTDPLAVNQRSPVEVGDDRLFSGVVAKELAGASLALEASWDLQSWQEIFPTWENEDQARGWSWSPGGISRAFLRLRVDLEILDES